MSSKREWNNYFIKNNREMLLDLTDFALSEQPEDNLMVAISFLVAWYNASYTMAAKPIKSLKLHYTMIKFLIIYLIYCSCVTLCPPVKFITMVDKIHCRFYFYFSLIDGYINQ